MGRLDERDQARIAAGIERLRNSAANTDDENVRRRYLRVANKMESSLRMRKLMPISCVIRMGFVGIALAPWALLTRLAHAPLLGVGVSLLVASILILVDVHLNREDKTP